jgi:peroxiredoxin Q/BCP
MTNQSSVKKSAGPVTIGDRAPDFTLNDQDGRPVHFSDLIGKGSIVLYFYPKDNTRGCTLEACAFRDSYEVFKQAGAIVIGVSDDTAESHAAFASQNRLPFTLLSDVKGEARKLYGVPKPLGIMPGRTTYVIDRDGVVRYTFTALMDGPKHVTESLRILNELNAQQPQPTI